MDNTLQDHILPILQKHLTGEPLTVEEQQMVEEWLALSPHNRLLWENIKQQGWLQQHLHEFMDFNPDEMWDKTLAHRVTKRPRIIRHLWRWAAAACILLGAGAYLWVTNKKEKSIVQQTQLVQLKNDVPAPDRTMATITMANGSVVYLDSIADGGAINNQQNVALVKTADGKIVYTPGSSGTVHEVAYNTLSNPRGSKVINMTLSDGSHIWLNAGSSITYPVVFPGTERKVSITGEAYFEVKQDNGKPFYISKGDMRVQVLGTHFNVKAYDDEADMRVTLLEGSVKVSAGVRESRVISPGQQAVVHASSRMHVINDVDLDEVMAWKNGMFNFNRQTVQAIMRDVARWYNLEISYQGTMSTVTFSGMVDRNSNLSQVLNIMEQAGVRFKVEGNKITVLQ